MQAVHEVKTNSKPPLDSPVGALVRYRAGNCVPAHNKSRQQERAMRAIRAACVAIACFTLAFWFVRAVLMLLSAVADVLGCIN